MKLSGKLALLFALSLLLALPAGASALNQSDLDASFGAGGVLDAGFKVDSKLSALIAQPDGKFLVGYESDGHLPVVRRYNVDGSVDSGFGSGGTAALPVPNGGTYGGVQRIVLDPDGTIYAIGRSVNGGIDRCAIWALNQLGALKVSFNPGGTPAGTVLLPLVGDDYNTLADAARAPSGDIVVAARAGNVGVAYISLRSVHADGSAGFVATRDIPTMQVIPGAIAIEPGGKVVVGGTVYTPYGPVPVIFGFTAAGAADPSFGGSGVITLGPGLGLGGDVRRLFHANGSLTAIGQAGYVDMVSRVSTAGVPDEGFGPYGFFRLLPLGSAFSILNDGIPVADGGTVAVGEAISSTPDQSLAHVLRLDAAGRPDAGFAPGGVALLSGASRSAIAVTLQSDGKYLIAMTDNDYKLSLARIWGDHPAPKEATAAFSSSLKSRSRAKRLRSIKGTSAGTGVTRVELAIQRVDSKLLKKKGRCRYLKNTKGQTKTTRATAGQCSPGTWLLARGDASWSLTLKKARRAKWRLAPGKYVLSVRASGVLGTGATTTRTITLTK